MTHCTDQVSEPGDSLGDLLQVVLVAAGVLAVLDLFLTALQNCSVGLCVGRVRQAGVAATDLVPAGTKKPGCW